MQHLQSSVKSHSAVWCTFRIHAWLFGYPILQLSFVILMKTAPTWSRFGSTFFFQCSISVHFKNQAWILKVSLLFFPLRCWNMRYALKCNNSSQQIHMQQFLRKNGWDLQQFVTVAMHLKIPLATWENIHLHLFNFIILIVLPIRLHN